MNETATPVVTDARSLKEARLFRGLSQERLAADLGIQQGYVSRLEHGHANPGPMLRHFLALYFDTTPAIVATWFPAREKKAA